MKSRRLRPEWTTFDFQDPVVWRKEDNTLKIKHVDQDLVNVDLHRHIDEFPLLAAERLFEGDKAANVAGPSTPAQNTRQSGSKRKLSQSHKGAKSPPKKKSGKQASRRVPTDDLEEEDHDMEVDVELGKGKGRRVESDSDEESVSGSIDAEGEAE